MQVDTTGYSLWGSSAGSRMAAYLGSYGTQKYIGKAHGKASAVVMLYTSHTDYTHHDPPSFALIGEEDTIASSPTVMQERIENLKNAGVETEFHLLPNLRHGFGLGKGTSAEGWHKIAVSFWEKYIQR